MPLKKELILNNMEDNFIECRDGNGKRRARKRPICWDYIDEEIVCWLRKSNCSIRRIQNFTKLNLRIGEVGKILKKNNLK
jgi:hypothetical protein